MIHAPAVFLPLAIVDIGFFYSRGRDDLLAFGDLSRDTCSPLVIFPAILGALVLGEGRREGKEEEEGGGGGLFM